MSENNVTARLLEDSANGPGETSRLVATTKGVAKIAAGSQLEAALAKLRASRDLTMGFISKPLAYSAQMPRHSKRDHANLIKLIKGGHVHIVEIYGKPPAGSIAHRDSPYGDRYYELRIGAW